MPIPWAKDETYFDRDLGSKVMHGPQLIATGSMRDGSGKAVDADFRILQRQEREINGFLKEYYEEPIFHQIAHGQEGRFEIHAIAPTDGFHLKVLPSGGLQEARPFQRGQNDLHFVIDPEFFLTGQLAIPEGFDAQDFRIRFFPKGVSPSAYMGVATPDAVPEEDGHFRLRALTGTDPGTVAILYEPSDAFLVGVENVQPIQKEGDVDPRLSPIDLAGLHHATIKVESHNQRWVHMVHYEVLEPTEGVEPAELYVNGDSFGITSLNQEVKIRMDVEGHAREYLTVSSGHYDVKLKKNRTVFLQLIDTPEIQTGFQLQCQIQISTDPPYRNDRHFLPGNWQEGFSIPIKEAGDYKLQLMIATEDGRRAVGSPELVLDFTYPEGGPAPELRMKIEESVLLDLYTKLQNTPEHQH